MIFLGLIVFAIVSCERHTSVDIYKKAILQTLQQQQNDWNSGDIEAYMQGYWKSEQLRFASGDRITYGWEKTLSNYQKSYPDKETMGKLHFTQLNNLNFSFEFYAKLFSNIYCNFLR